ncbi:MAG: helicase-associated domain-containing protein [Synergistaceae bacterium]|jgi:hypothetical protein|nr:helicase-associated domain-containing protein [Synergistaceae bacterium]
MKQIVETLSLLPIGDKGKLGSLRHLAFIASKSIYSSVKNSQKDDLVSVLNGYYSAPNRFGEIWNNLSMAERKIASIHLWSGGNESRNWADLVAEEYGLPEKHKSNCYSYSYAGLDRFKKLFAETDSKLWLLFPRNGMSFFKDEMLQIIGEMKREYSDVSAYVKFFSREDRSQDFTSIVKYCNSNKLSTTGRGVLSKSSAVKLIEYCGYAEFAEMSDLTPSQVRTTDQLLVTFPLTMLCSIGGLLALSEGQCVPGAKSLKLLSMPIPELISNLLDNYLKSKTFDEISIMSGIKSKRGRHAFEARQNLIEELKRCPIGKPIYTAEFERYLQLVNKSFARKDESYIVETGNDHYGVEWEYYEHPLIFIILSFLGALGIIDIAWEKIQERYDKCSRLRPTAFRINPLGAYVLHLTDDYKPMTPIILKSAIGFTVLPDFTIVVPESADRLKQEMFFERFFTKVSQTKEVTIYKLDFDTVVRAKDTGKNVDYLRKHLSSSHKVLPDNVLRALDDWEKQFGRIRLRRVTILECDDKALLEEVIHYKGIGEFIKGRVSEAVIIDGDRTGSIKKIIEKNERLCQDVI